MERYNGVEPDPEGAFVYYDDAQRALDAERERVKELKEWQRVVVGTGTDQEAVVRMAATEYTKTAVQCWKDENAKLTAQLATLQAQLAQPIRVCQGCGRVGRDGWVTARYECDELHGSLQCPDCQCIDLEINTAKELAALCTQAQAQLVRWKEALGEWLWNCTNLLGDYHIKTVQDFNEEVNRRIAWLMERLDHTLPPPMTDEERDRMQKLSEGNAALQADNECKDSLIETLQAQLRQVEGERDAHAQDVDELIECCINDVLVTHATPGGKPHDPDPQIRPLRDKIAGALVELQTLRQLVEAFVQHFDSDFENPGLELYGRVNGGEISNGGKGLNELLAKARATLAAQDAGKHHEVD